MNDFSIHNGDCLDVMQTIPDGSVDMIMTDLPYGTTSRDWDCIIPFPELWKHYNRVTKENAAIVLNAQAPFDKVLGCSNMENLRYEYVWIKNQATGFLNAKKMPLKAHENILVFYRKLPTYNPQLSAGRPYHMVHKDPHKFDTTSVYGKTGLKSEPTVHHNDGFRYPTSELQFDVEVGYHPTQKPVPLIKWLIKTYTNPGELVLDSTMGSGTTGVACAECNRRFIGIEKDPKIFEIAKGRIDTAVSQIRLF